MFPKLLSQNKVTPNKNAVDDYNYCFNLLFPYVDYFVVNEVLQLTKHLDSAFTLCELVQGGRHVLRFGSGCFLVPLAAMHAWIHYVSSD